MRLLDLNVVKLTICLISGIIIGYYYPFSVSYSLSLTLFSTALLSINFIIAKNQFTKTIWFGLLAFISMISIGILTTTLHNQKNFKSHYSKHISTPTDNENIINFKIREVLKSSNYYNKYIVEIISANNNKTSGKVILNIAKDSTKTRLKADAVYMCKTTFKELNEPLNPHQFDYKSYLEKKYIYHQLHVSNTELYKISSNTHTILGVANNIRDFINSKLSYYHFKPDELAIINALILGQRQDISKDIYANYTNSGTIHILAVSGLHVGIILMIISFILKPLEQIKHGKLIKTAVLIMFLWGFAFITGLSASVTRAVTMFSVLTIAINLNRPSNIYNTMAVSLFIILLFKPMFLFDVGFQLSYLAVLSIVVLDPYLYKLWQPQNWLLDTYWHTFTVTLSAQLGIIPVSLFYFHQFPGLFFISNLVIIPLLGIILGLGILVITLASINGLPQIIATVFGYAISSMNDFVAWISKLEAFVFKDIPFNAKQMLLAYLIIILGSLFLIKKQAFYIKLFLASIIVCQCYFIINSYTKTQQEFIIFHKNKGSLIGRSLDKKLVYSEDFDSTSISKTSPITDYIVGNQISLVKKDTLKHIYKLNKKTLLVVDHLGVYNIKSFSPDYILLRQSPRINLNRLIDSISPKHIIADGSNYKSHINYWEAVCKKRKLPFHQTGKKGAFIIPN